MTAQGPLDGRDIERYLGVATETLDATTSASYDLRVPLDRHEYETIVDAMQSVMRVKSNAPLGLVRKSYRELTKLRSYYATLFESRRPKTRAVRALDASFILMWASLNWLAAFRLFLDHEETTIKRQYGSDSPQVVKLREATSSAYDGSIAYRVVYKFRNYVQHCGLPLSNVSQSSVDREGQRARIDFTVGRDHLLDDHGRVWNAKVREDLGSMPDQIDILSLIAEAMVDVSRSGALRFPLVWTTYSHRYRYCAMRTSA